MAQFFWTANPADIGGPPGNLGIVQPWEPLGTLRVVDETIQTGFPVAGVTASLEITVASNSSLRRLAALVSVDGVAIPQVVDAEIWMHYVAIGTNETRGALRADLAATAATATVLVGGLKNTGTTTENGRYLNGGFSALDSGPGAGPDVYKQRLRAEGSTFLAKLWRAADPEPANWLLVSNAVGVSTPGAVGWFQFRSVASEKRRIIAIGVGTDGDSAPDAAPTMVPGPAAATAFASAASLGMAGLGHLRQRAAVAVPGPAAGSDAIGKLRLPGQATTRLPAPMAIALGASGGFSTLAASLSGLSANAAARLRVIGNLAALIRIPRLVASAGAGGLAFLVPTPGRTSTAAAGSRDRQAGKVHRQLVPIARPRLVKISAEETNDG